MARVRASDIEELKSRVDIVEIIGSYVQLKPSTAGSFKGLCPFHQEKSPSFNVRSNPAFYHCFGCGQGGDVYKFLQEIESLSFSDAVVRLAEKAGYQLSYEDGTAEVSQRSRLLAANQAAAEFYQGKLASDEASSARELLLQRGFDAESAKKFGVGYAPKGWKNLIDHLTKKGFTLEELVTAGLAMNSDKGGYDRFRGRLLWPIRDANSQILGFGARKLYADDEGPKYLNTPETPVYHKSQVLYGLDLARKSIAKKRQIVVVEGYTDVMACHLAGVETAVATCGTAFGEEHIKVINRLLGSATEEPAQVIFTFDPDAAGEKAALRVYGDTAKFNALTFVAVGPDGLDPSDLRQQRGDQAIQKILENKKPLFEFVIRHRIAKFNLQDLDSRVAAARAAAPVVAEISDPALRMGYIRQLAEWVTLGVSDVNDIVSSASKSTKAQAVEGLRTSEALRPASNPNGNRQERQILEVMVQIPNAFSATQLRKISAAGMSDANYQRVVDAVSQVVSQELPGDFHNNLLNTIPGELAPLVRELALAQLPVGEKSDLEKYTQGIVRGAIIQALSREKEDLLGALRRLDPATQSDAISAVQRQLVELEAERRHLM